MIYNLNAYFLSTKNKNNADTFMVGCRPIYLQPVFPFAYNIYHRYKQMGREHQPQSHWLVYTYELYIHLWLPATASAATSAASRLHNQSFADEAGNSLSLFLTWWAWPSKRSTQTTNLLLSIVRWLGRKSMLELHYVQKTIQLFWRQLFRDQPLHKRIGH
jgi:hypothetical protein